MDRAVISMSVAQLTRAYMNHDMSLEPRDQDCGTEITKRVWSAGTAQEGSVRRQQRGKPIDPPHHLYG